MQEAVAPRGVPLAETTSCGSLRRLKLLVAGAHPDDPETACGGLSALYAAAGHEVVHLYLTRGEAGIPGLGHAEAAVIRTEEAEQACAVLGARPAFAGQIDGACEVNASAYEHIRQIVEAEAPDVVVTHWPVDTHRDHRAIASLVYDAWLRSAQRFALYYFEVLSGEQTQHFSPTHIVDITSVEPLKREACFTHESQRPDGMYAAHERMQRFRGLEIGVEHAEAFIRQHQAS